MDEKKKELSQKEKRTLMIVSLAIVLALIFGISYAYFLAQDTSAEQQITTQNIGLVLDDGTEDDTVTVEMAKNIKPIVREEILTKAAKKNFTITNNGEEKMFVDITLEDMTLPPALKRYDFMWSLYEVIDGVEKNVSNGSFANATDSVAVGKYLVFDAPVVTDGTTTYDEKEYNLYIWLEETNLNQNTMMGQEFKATIVATGEVYHTSPESDFVINQSGAITEYTGSGGNVIIPKIINNTEVKSISESVFASKGLTNIVLPDSIVNINAQAFQSNSLTSLFIPNSVTFISGAAFRANQITNISIPNSASNILSNAFANNALTDVVIPNTISGISSETFYYNNLTNVIIPNSVTSIGDRAFNYNSISSIVIPSKVTTIGTEVFTGLVDIQNVLVLGKNSSSDFTSLGTNWCGSATVEYQVEYIQ